MSLRQFAEENIFKPLGMNNTHFHDDRTLVVKNRVTAYLPGSNGGFSTEITNDESVGAGGLYSTIEDLFLWDQNFYNNKLGGGPDLISEELSTGMLNNGEKIGYAFGLHVDGYKGLKRIRHGGAGAGFKNEMIRFPEQKVSVIRLCNGSNIPWGQSEEVADIFLADQFKKSVGGVSETVAAAPDIISIPEKELASLAGLYFEPIKEWINRFYMKDGKLMVDPDFKEGNDHVLLPLGQNHFKVGGGPVEIVFVRPIAGGPMQVKVISGGITRGTLDAVQSGTPTSAQLAEFTGKYVSDELAGATYTLSIKDGKLLLLIRNGITVFSDRGLMMAFTQPSRSEAPKDILLTPVFADFFSTLVSDERVTVRFTRNQQNAVSGFTLSTGTVRRLRFNKL